MNWNTWWSCSCLNSRSFCFLEQVRDPSSIQLYWELSNYKATNCTNRLERLCSATLTLSKMHPTDTMSRPLHFILCVCNCRGETSLNIVSWASLTYSSIHAQTFASSTGQSLPIRKQQWNILSSVAPVRRLCGLMLKFTDYAWPSMTKMFKWLQSSLIFLFRILC